MRDKGKIEKITNTIVSRFACDCSFRLQPVFANSNYQPKPARHGPADKYAGSSHVDPYDDDRSDISSSDDEPDFRVHANAAKYSNLVGL